MRLRYKALMIVGFFLIMHFINPHLSKKEKQWYAGCEAMASAKFISLNGEIQEIGYLNKQVSDKSWIDRFFHAFNVGTDYSPYVGVYFQFETLKTPSGIVVSLSAYASKEKHGSILSFNLGYLTYECPLDSVKLKSFLIKGKRYDDCVEVDENNSFHPDYAKRDLDFVSRYIWSKEHGLVYFKLKDGTVYFREDLQ